MSSLPKVSIILTSFNRPHFLREAIESVLNQTLKNIELIIVDDCSTISAVDQIIDNYAYKDNRIKAFKTSRNINNIAILWNKGIDNSSGEYIALLDDDNLKFPEFCEKMSNWLDENKEYYAVACFAQVVKNTIENKAGIFDFPAKMTSENIRYDNYVDSGCMMFRRSLIDEIGWFDERMKTNEDWDYVKRIVFQTSHGFGVIPEPLCYYRWHDSNRLLIRDQLGDPYFRKMLDWKNYNRVQKLLFFHQDCDKLTLSQRNVLFGILSALKELNFLDVESMAVSHLNRCRNLKSNYDMLFIFAPFSIDIHYIARLSAWSAERIHFHIEDPQAMEINSKAAKYATYIWTNDISVKQEYEKIVGFGRCGFCPSISFDDIHLKLPDSQKEYDIVFYGYAYDSRKQFMQRLEPKLKKAGLNYLVIGGGWSRKNSHYIGELSQDESLALLAKSKIVILKNRSKTDLGGGDHSIQPQSVVRGYFEAGSGALVMIDSERQHHSFDGEVIFYQDVADLEKKIIFFLENEDKRKKISQAAQKRALSDWTYRTRMRKLVNVVRSQRFNIEIK